MLKYLCLIILISLLIVSNKGITTVAPNWLTSQYFQGDFRALISTPTGNTSTPQFTFNFATPFTGNPPQIAYGIKSYKGNDKLLQQRCQINRFGVPDLSTFSVQVQILGITTVLQLDVAYIAVDSNFPHHLNSFDNVPLNISGPLSNVSLAVATTRTFTQIVDYTAQASGRSSNTFSSPFTNNKILLFLSTFHLAAANGNNPFVFASSYYIFNTSHYSMTASISSNCRIEKLHFSQIIFNYQDVISSNTYEVVYYITTQLTDGGSISIPAQFVSNFMMGLAYFKAANGTCSIDYQWQFITASSQVNILKSNQTGSGSGCPLSQMSSVVFYIKKWECPATHPFYNISTSLCQDGCDNYNFENVTDCIACHYSCFQCSGQSITQCSGCDQTNDFRTLNGSSCNCMSGYHENYTTNSICLSCGAQVSNCASCTPINAANNIVCDDCGDGFYALSSTACAPCSNVLTQCLSCSNDGTQCVTCNEAGQYFLNSSNLCQHCTSQITGCLICLSINVCSSCDNSALYYLDSNSSSQTYQKCALCTSLISNCVTCTNDTYCSVCDTGNNYFMVPDPNHAGYSSCVACTLQGCSICASLTVCSVCNGALNYFIDSNVSSPTYQTCIGCSIQNCQLCYDLQNCQNCDEAHDFFMDVNASSSTYGKCIACPLIQCNDCVNMTHCLSCNNQYYPDKYDPASLTYGQCLLCQDWLPNCIICTNDSYCAQCSSGYYRWMDISTNAYGSCVPCSVTNCDVCLNDTFCLTCLTNYFENYNVADPNYGLCQPCSVSNCQLCSDVSHCQICNSRYSLDNDSLSSQYGKCIQDCTLVQDKLQLIVTYIEKLQSQNKIQIDLFIDPWHSIFCQNTWQVLPLPSSVFIFQQVSLQNTSLIAEEILCDNTNHKLKIRFSYDKVQQKKSVIMTLNPQFPLNYPNQQNCPPAPITLPVQFILQPDNNIPIIPFSQQQYKNAAQAQTALTVVKGSAYAVAIASTFSCKIVGIQLFGVLQLSFFTLGDNDDINLYLRSFLDAGILNGFNTKVSNYSKQQNRKKNAIQARLRSAHAVFPQANNIRNRMLQTQDLAFSNEEVPSRINALGFQSPLFIDNCNIMLLILLIEIIVALILYGLTKCIKKSKLKIVHKISRFLMEQIFLTLILFNSFNIAFSASVHFTYANGTQQLYVLSSALAIISLFFPAILIIVLVCVDSKSFGQYKNKFKQDFPSQSYFAIMLIFRIGLGVYIGAMNQYQTSTLIATFVSIAVLMYTLINLPFKQAYHNYRAVLINGTITLALFVTMYYRSMKSSFKIQQRAVIFTPAIVQISAIFLCVIVSTIILIYEIYLFCKEKSCCKSQQQSNKSTKTSNIFDPKNINAIQYTQSQFSIVNNNNDQNNEPQDILKKQIFQNRKKNHKKNSQKQDHSFSYNQDKKDDKTQNQINLNYNI